MDRFKTRVVKIGNVAVGGGNPIRIQSMTNTSTFDVKNTIEQIKRLQDCGCDIVRVTVQGLKEAYACEKIKSQLISQGYDIPIVADIHFYPKAAIIVSDFVDKVRINPGNFVSQKKDDPDALLKIKEAILPLLTKLKKQKKALRIGVNHGSLSERILYNYGNTPLGMVHSACEYSQICMEEGFYDLFFSMKSSSPPLMIQAYKLLVAEMKNRNWDFPLHLGVTEAGDEEDGIIKSSVGIGALLLDGIGDTIRISLTADPEKEILPSQKLINYIESKRKDLSAILESSKSSRKEPLVILKNETEEISKDYVDGFFEKEKSLRLLKTNQLISVAGIDKITDIEIEKDVGVILKDIKENSLNKIKNLNPAFIFFSPETDRIFSTSFLRNWLDENEISSILIAYFSYLTDELTNQIAASAEIGKLIMENQIDGICLDSNLPLQKQYDLSLAIMQALQKKIVKTEYISCPGCGRTLYDIENVVKKIKEKTSHLPGVKIAIMGCIVNGLGEMADADFGFVGSGKDTIDLYVGKKCIEKNINFSLAVDKLIEVIKQEGKWVERNS